jgi:arylsulfatase A-like enzyme
MSAVPWRAARGPLWPCLCAVAASACAPEGARAPGTVASAVLVTLDTTRLNAVGLYDCPADSTPELDALARESLVYDWCRSVAPLTLPAHASMLTGLYPPRHGVRENGIAPLPGAAATVAERAREAGLATAAFVGALVLDRQYGLDQGFQVYDQPPRPARQLSSRYAERGAGEVLSAAQAWLAELPARARFLLWVHLFDPHAPYEPPPRFLSQVQNAAGQGHPYVAEVAKIDHELGRFFDGLRGAGRLEDTLLAVIADHGEDLGDHGEPNHAAYVYDTTLRVPFLLCYPDGYRAGERSDEIASVVDVAPTLCSALGLAPLPGIDGHDLWRASVPAGRGVYFESYHGYLTYGWAPLAGWADAAGKYIHGPEPELYSPASDRLERRNEFAADPARAEPYRGAIAALARHPKLAPEGFAGGAAEREAALAALGYAAAAASTAELPSPLDDTGLPSPPGRRAELRSFLEAQQLVEQGDVGAALPLLEGILAENPRHQAALEKLGLARVMRGDWGPAIEVLERRLALGPANPSTHVNLALALESRGHLERAVRHLEQALELDPEEPTARHNLERVRSRLGPGSSGGGEADDPGSGR